MKNNNGVRSWYYQVRWTSTWLIGTHIWEKSCCVQHITLLGVKLKGTLQVFDGCARSKGKLLAVRKTNYTRVSHPGKSISVDTTGPLPEILIGNRYWIGVVDNCSRYSWSLFKKTKYQLPKKMEEFF